MAHCVSINLTGGFISKITLETNGSANILMLLDFYKDLKTDAQKERVLSRIRDNAVCLHKYMQEIQNHIDSGTEIRSWYRIIE